MLVLSRRNHQKIVFPSVGITVEILKISGNKVSVGIEAPTDVSIHRSEVAERIYRDGLRHEHPK
jgi:carbon storage regulator CsrA